MKNISIALALLVGSSNVTAADMPNGANNFYTSAQVTVQKVSFKNQYQMNVTGNLYIPKNVDRSKKHAAIVVGHPMERSRNKAPTCTQSKWRNRAS